MRIKDDFSSFFKSLLGFIQTRASLFRLEFAQEKQRMVSVAILSVLTMIFVAFVFLMMNIAVLVYFWDTDYRLWSIVGLAVTYAVLAITCLIVLKKQLKGGVFPYTQSVLKEDIKYFQLNTTESLDIVKENRE